MKKQYPKTIAAFPMRGNSYTELFYDGLVKRGFRIMPGVFSGRWLLNHLPEIGYCHFHWPSFLYHRKSGSRVENVMSFARFVALLLLIRMKGVGIIWTAHNLYPHDGGKDQLSHRLGRHLTILLSDIIFVHGPTPEKVLLNEFPRARGKTSLIEHGHWIGHYPHDTDSSEARRKLGLSEESYVYLFIGLCKEYKNIEMLLEAFQRMPDHCHLVIAGKFQSDEYHERIASRIRGLSDRITLHAEFVPDEELQYFLEAADIVVLPYKEILTSGAAVLTMTFGKPLIACREGSLVDLINPSVGMLFSPTTTEQLVEAMNRAREMKFSRETIQDRIRQYDWERSAESFAMALQKCEASKGRPDRGTTEEPGT